VALAIGDAEGRERAEHGLARSTAGGSTDPV
jgi:hypothetical protein